MDRPHCKEFCCHNGYRWWTDINCSGHEKSLLADANFNACLVESPKPPEPRKYEKNTKKITKSPTQGRAPKIRKKYRKNAKMVIFRVFLFFFPVFFPYFWGPDPGWGILYIFRIFFVFLGFRGFWALYQASGIVILADTKFNCLSTKCGCRYTPYYIEIARFLRFVIAIATADPGNRDFEDKTWQHHIAIRGRDVDGRSLAIRDFELRCPSEKTLIPLSLELGPGRCRDTLKAHTPQSLGGGHSPPEFGG